MPPLIFTYKNYRGEVSERRVEPQQFMYGKNIWHHEEQWFLRAMDLDKGEIRNFAVKDIVFAPTTLPTSSTLHVNDPVANSAVRIINATGEIDA